MTVRGWAWGAESSSPETPETWDYWTEEGTTNTARNDGGWGRIQFLPGDEFVSPVKDLGSTATRFLILAMDKYGVGKGSGTLYWRGRDTDFSQSADEISGPVWELYTAGGSTKTWRYVQIKAVG